MSRFSTIAASALAASLIAACSDSTGPAGRPGVSLSFSTKSPTRAFSAYSAPSSDVVVGSGADAITIDTAQIVLREIELKQDSAAGCLVDGGEDECEELEVGPVLVNLPLGAGVSTQVPVQVPAGSYREVEFELHSPSGDGSRDGAFRLANPAFANASVRVTGTYQGQRFTYVAAVEAEQEHEFATPLVVDGSESNLTINVDVGSWFKDAASGAVIAPTTANASRIEGNIKRSFDAFEDDDRDGQDD